MKSCSYCSILVCHASKFSLIFYDKRVLYWWHNLNGDTNGNTVPGLYGLCYCTTEPLLRHSSIAMLSCIVFCLYMFCDGLVFVQRIPLSTSCVSYYHTVTLNLNKQGAVIHPVAAKRQRFLSGSLGSLKINRFLLLYLQLTIRTWTRALLAFECILCFCLFHIASDIFIEQPESSLSYLRETAGDYRPALNLLTNRWAEPFKGQVLCVSPPA